jgi:hypothetical protein
MPSEVEDVNRTLPNESVAKLFRNALHSLQLSGTAVQAFYGDA